MALDVELMIASIKPCCLTDYCRKAKKGLSAGGVVQRLSALAGHGPDARRLLDALDAMIMRKSCSAISQIDRSSPVAMSGVPKWGRITARREISEKSSLNP